MAKKFTTIQMTPETREKLKSLGKKGDSYEDIILKLISGSKRP